ncbi:MAG: hypothetical protein K1Y36_09230 [Blastocatellia bacterium]|nr:hypothetical protein [Blastocatellia bacterium]
MLNRNQISVLLLSIGLVWVVLLCFGWAGIPLYNGDSVAYMPPVVNVANGQGLTNTFSNVATFYDPSGAGRFSFHGFLYQLLLGTVLTGKTAHALFVANACLCCLCVGLTGGASVLALRKQQPVSNSWLVTLVLSVSAFSLGGFVFGVWGRPELFSMVLLAGFGLVLQLVKPERWWIPIGIWTALLAVSNPVPAIFTTVIAVGLLFARREFRPALWETCQAGTLSLTLFGTCLAVLYPYSVGEWFGNLQKAASITYEQGSSFQFSELVSNLVAFPAYPLVVIPVSLSLGSLIFFMGWSGEPVRNRGIVWGCSGVLALLVYKYILLKPSQIYSLVALLPLGYVSLTSALVKLGQLWNEQRRTVFQLAGGTLVLLLVCSTVGLVRRSVLYGFYLKYGVTYAQTRAVFDRLQAEHSGPIGVTQGLWVLTEKPGTIYPLHTPLAVAPYSRGGGKYLVFQQDGFKTLIPPVLEGYDLVFSSFSPVRPRLFHVSIGNTVPGYQIAVYKIREGVVSFPLRFQPPEAAAPWGVEIAPTSKP